MYCLSSGWVMLTSAMSSSSMSLELQVALEIGLDLLRRQHLHGEEVVLSAGDVAQAVLVAALVEEVGEDDDDALVAVREGEALARLGEVTRAGRVRASR